MVWLEELCQWKISMTPSGIEPTSFLIIGVKGNCCTWSHSVRHPHSAELFWVRDRPIAQISICTTCPWGDWNPVSLQACKPYTMWPMRSAFFFCVYHKFFFVKPYLSILNNIFNLKLKEEWTATDAEWWHTYSSTIKGNKEFRLFITIHTYVQSSLVMLEEVVALFGEVKLLLGFTQTSPKSMPSARATACATCNKLPCYLLPYPATWIQDLIRICRSD
jgi:hypothetical protein